MANIPVAPKTRTNISISQLRCLAEALLDDEQGIPEKAWPLLEQMLIDADLTELIDCIDSNESRVYFDQEIWSGFKDEVAEEEAAERD